MLCPHGSGLWHRVHFCHWSDSGGGGGGGGERWLHGTAREGGPAGQAGGWPSHWLRGVWEQKPSRIHRPHRPTAFLKPSKHRLEVQVCRSAPTLHSLDRLVHFAGGHFREAEHFTTHRSSDQPRLDPRQVGQHIRKLQG